MEFASPLQAVIIPHQNKTNKCLIRNDQSKEYNSTISFRQLLSQLSLNIHSLSNHQLLNQVPIKLSSRDLTGAISELIHLEKGPKRMFNRIENGSIRHILYEINSRIQI